MENREIIKPSEYERLFWNVVKGIAIFLMLWGHCIQCCALDTFNFFENRLFKTIYSFHMPLFIFVSGFLFYYSCQKRSCLELVSHRAAGMLHPIIGATVLNNLFMTIPTLVLSRKLELLNGSLFRGMEWSLWFLWSVLACSTVVAVAYKTTRSSCWRAMLVFVGIFFVILFPFMDNNLFMYPFFVGGVFCAEHKKRILRFVRKWKYFLLIPFPAMLPFYKTEHYIYITPVYKKENGFIYCLKIDLFRTLIGFAGILFVLIIIDWLLQVLIRQKNQKKVLAITKLGENSLQIYCISVSLLSGYLPPLYQKVVELMGQNVLAANWFVYNLIFTPLLALAYCILLLFVIQILQKAKIHTLIFGR